MKLNLTHKNQAKLACLLKVRERLNVCRNQLEQIQQDLGNETKSSAGDKYETGRAMLHIEREKIGRQLHELEQLQSILVGINEKQVQQKVQLGSLVCTQTFIYFVSVSLGELKTEDFTFYAISKSTPMAQAMLGCSMGESFNFRGLSYTVLSIH